MPQRGRPPQPGTAEEKAALRREKVRLYVKAHRERKKAAAVAAESVSAVTSPDSHQSKSSSPPSDDTAAITPESSQQSADDNVVIREDHQYGQGEELAETETSLQKSAVTKSEYQRRPAQFSLGASPNDNKALGFALLGAFRGQFLPLLIRVPDRQGYGSELVTPCSPWITHAYNIAVAQDSSALKTSLMAVGLALTSMQTQDQRLRMASLEVYRKALGQVRKDIQPLTTGRKSNYLITYLSCLATAMFELLHEGFSENIMSHVKGAITLITLLPKDTNVSHLLNDLLLEDLCMWEIVFALKYRYPSPLRAIRHHKGARKYSVAGVDKASSQNATTLGDLLDCADELSAIMATLDLLKKAPIENGSARVKDLNVEIEKLDRKLKAFDAWELQFLDRFEPIFAQVGTNPTTGDPIMQFSSYEVSAPWVYYLTFKICAIETEIEALSELLLLSVEDITVDVGTRKLTQANTIVSSVLTSNKSSQPTGMGLATASSTTGTESLSNPCSQTTHARLQTLRTSLRTLTAQLVEALCLFLPIPKGFIGASLVLFPLDRAKAMLKREIARLELDLANTKAPSTQSSDNTTTTTIVAELDDMFQSMTIHDSLEQALSRFGMPPMPEDKTSD